MCARIESPLWMNAPSEARSPVFEQNGRRLECCGMGVLLENDEGFLGFFARLDFVFS